MSTPVPPSAGMAEPQRPETAGTSDTTPAVRSSWWAGRSGLLLSLLMVVFSTYLLIGILTMEVREGTDFPGPRFFPGILMVAGYVLAGLLALQYVRSPEHPTETSSRTYRTFTDWPAVLWSAGGFLLFALTLETLGWIIAAALLFWCVAKGFGSRRPLFDVSFSLVISSAIYLAFSVGLGLNLPSGILGGGF